MEKQIKRPMRSCCVCGNNQVKKELVRFVRTPDGFVELDVTGKAAGRGAYLCADMACFSKAVKQHRLERALKISIGESEYDQLAKEFSEILG